MSTMAKKSNYTQEWQDNAALSDYETELALKQERKHDLFRESRGY